MQRPGNPNRAPTSARIAWLLVILSTAMLVGLPGCRRGAETAAKDTTAEGKTSAAPKSAGEPSKPAAPASPEDDATTAGPEGRDTSTGTVRIEWDFSPKTLDVYRDTRVTFRVQNAGALPEGWRYAWTFGDGSPEGGGAVVEHLYRGGQSDHLATLTVKDGENEVYVASRNVPLERLPVVPLAEKDDAGFAPDLAIPEAPAPSDTSFRFVVMSDSNGPYGSVDQGAHAAGAVRSIIERVRPEFVVHNGDMVAGQSRELSRNHLEKMWGGYNATIAAPLRAAGLPLVPVAGNHDASPALPDRDVYVAEWSRPAMHPDVTFVNKQDYPLRYTFTWKGAFFLVMDGAVGRVDEEQIRWIRRQLEDTRIYTARFVFSHVPLHKFTEVRYGDLVHPEERHDPLRKSDALDRTEFAGLQKHFRLYNLFLEHNVTMLFSGHYEVYYKGRYGALRVISTGNIAGTRRALSGQNTAQGSSFVVIDIVDGRPKNVFAVRGPEFTKRFDETELPQEVEVYRYDPDFTPGIPSTPMPQGLLDR